jgi:pyruvate-ferredoxin/flavodoxin oxidoreductase
MAGDNPMGRDIRTALNKALQGEDGLPRIMAEEMPRLFGGIYGLGSRDFRPEHVIGAYEFALGQRVRKDGKRAADGVSFMVLGVDHPYEVKADDTPSLLPAGAIAVRFHSVGGWGAITTGKNLGAIIGDLNDLLYDRDKIVDEFGNPKEIIHVSANPKYGSEKKGAPTSYFMIAAPERIRVNCDLRHVNVVLCCDPKRLPTPTRSTGWRRADRSYGSPRKKASRRGNGCRSGLASRSSTRTSASLRCPGSRSPARRPTAATSSCACRATRFSAPSLRCRRCCRTFASRPSSFRDAVHKQYVKKFGKLGEAVVSSNMEVMTKGFELVREIRVGELEAADRSTLRGKALLPVVPQFANGGGESCGSGCRSHAAPEGQGERTPLTRVSVFDSEFRSDYGYDQPSSPLAALGVMAAGSGDTASKYVARRETPLYIPENCTQCMECIAVCPDTALPNCSQDLGTVLQTAISNYVSDTSERQKMLHLLPEIEKRTRDLMRDGIEAGSAAAAAVHHPEGHQRGERLLDPGEAGVLRRHRQGAAGLPEDERNLRDAREEGGRWWRRLLHFRVRLV